MVLFKRLVKFPENKLILRKALQNIIRKNSLWLLGHRGLFVVFGKVFSVWLRGRVVLLLLLFLVLPDGLQDVHTKIADRPQILIRDLQ